MGVMGQLLSLFLGVLLPKLLITSYGSEVNGLLSSVTNIYAYIALVEAGVAAASCQALYKPIAEHNRADINALLSATNKYYFRTGYIYLGLILIFSLFYPVLINSNIPYYTIVLIILFNGFGNVVNYFFHGKYLILLRADGKNYIRTGLETFTNSLKHISKIILISLGYDVIFVQMVAMLVSFVQMIYITLYMKKYYPWINLKVKPNELGISQSKNVFVHEINYFITANVDVVLLTIFTTLKEVSVYSLYNLLFGTINSALRVVRDSIEFKIARLFHADRQKFVDFFRVFEVYYITFSFVLFSVAFIFMLPFITQYTKGVTDTNYVIPILPLLFVVINLLSAGRYPSDAMIHISGHFKETQNSAIVESVINIVVSIFFVIFWGIPGVLVGTIASSLYRTNYLIKYVNRNIMGENEFVTYRCWGANLLIFLVVIIINYFIPLRINSYIQIFAYCIPYLFFIAAVYFCFISIIMKKEFRLLLTILKMLLHNRKQ